MNIFALDTEITTFNKGNPFDERNHLVLGAFGNTSEYHRFNTNHMGIVQELLDRASMVVLFNAKFDLHWLRKCGVTFSVRLPIWDCQLAEFILSNQQWKYPSLDESCEKRKLPRKLDIVKTEYWDKGINTDAIPFEILDEYLKGDIVSTFSLYLAQVEEFKKPEHQGKYKLFRLHCYDLMVLQQMEYNGYVYDVRASREEAIQLEKECSKLDSAILAEYPDVPINLGSPDHISCMLYGGTIVETIKVPVGVYKSGTRQGEVKYRNMDQEYVLPRLIEPIRGSELAKEGYFGTSEDILRNLPAKGKVKKIIGLLLERRGIEKLRGTYYNGVPDLIDTMHWKDNIVHGQLNQCVAKSGRLSATKPNQQNMSSSVKRFCISRYND